MSTSWVKRRLRAHGFWPRPLPINNHKPGRITRSWIMRFQKARGLEVDGVVGPQTIGALKEPRVSRERQRALKWASTAVGIVEQPPGSNDGPRIRRWWTEAGYSYPVPYCACFTSTGVQHATRGRIKARQLGGYCPSIVAIARAGSLGFKLVPLEQALPGDLVMFDFGRETYDHVGFFVRHDGDHIRTIEANTSPDDSDPSIHAQANGGGVFRRRRSRGLVSAVVRPSYR